MWQFKKKKAFHLNWIKQLTKFQQSYSTPPPLFFFKQQLSLSTLPLQKTKMKILVQLFVFHLFVLLKCELVISLFPDSGMANTMISINTY